ncbi:hypothetical protein [Clostridium sp.]
MVVIISKIIVPKSIPPTEINRFLGLNENVDAEYGLQLGEATKQIGWRVTSGMQLKRMEGYKTLFSDLIGKVQGLWFGKLNSISFFLFTNNGHLYKGNLIDGTKIDLGTLTDAPTSFLPFGNKVYLWNGTEYKSFDGTNFITVIGYRPLVSITSPPTGGGTLYEQVNVLNGTKHQTFSPVGTVTAYQLAETSITSVDFVKINGVTKTVTTDYTVNLSTGIVTFVVAPTVGVPNSVDIGWTKGTGQRNFIENCRFAMDYSGQTDSRVFLWGNTNFKNRRFWSGLADGVPSAEYFEANSYDDLGTGQYAITDIVKQYDRQKIFLEDSAMYSYYTTSTDALGIVRADFPVFELNEGIGNVAFNQVQIVKNNPLSLYSGVRQWASTTVRDEYNESLISQRVQDTLDNADLTKAITYDWQENKEYWLVIDGVAWIYNYLNDTWYKRNNVNATCFIVIKGIMYFGTNGTIERFDKDLRNDNGQVIETCWEMGFYDFKAEYMKKYMSKLWIGLKPNTKTKVNVTVITNNEGTLEPQTIYYNLHTFLHQDFNHMSFNTSYNAQPFPLKMKAKGFAYMKIKLDVDTLTDTATILSINIAIRYGGKI